MSKVYVVMSKTTKTPIGVYETKFLAEQFSDNTTEIFGPYFVHGAINTLAPPNSPVTPIIFPPELGFTEPTLFPEKTSGIKYR